MKLIFLYGPPAVGKLTIAKLLQQKTEYTLLHNHLLQNPVSEVFPFDNPASWILVREFRLRILEEAIKSNINLLMTFGIVSNYPFDHIQDVLAMMKRNNATLLLVHLTADRETLIDRVEDQFRHQHGKTLSKEKLAQLLEENPEMMQKFPGVDHLAIDTSHVVPEQSVAEILRTYSL